MQKLALVLESTSLEDDAEQLTHFAALGVDNGVQLTVVLSEVLDTSAAQLLTDAELAAFVHQDYYGPATSKSLKCEIERESGSGPQPLFRFVFGPIPERSLARTSHYSDRFCTQAILQLPGHHWIARQDARSRRA